MIILVTQVHCLTILQRNDISLPVASSNHSLLHSAPRCRTQSSQALICNLSSLLLVLLCGRYTLHQQLVRILVVAEMEAQGRNGWHEGVDGD